MTTTTEIKPDYAAMTVADLMEALTHEAAFRGEQNEKLTNLPAAQALQAAISGSMTRTNEIQKALQAQLKDAPGVLDTEFGKVGYQERRTVTHSAAAVRELAPDLAPMVIAETVDKKALETMAKAAIKAGKLPDTLLADLEARADVKVSNAWICQPTAPAAAEQ